MLLDRRQRFADASPEFLGDLAEGSQNIFFSRGLCLLLVEDVFAAAALRTQPQDVLVSQACNGALQHGSASGTFTNLASHLGRKRRIGRTLPINPSGVPDSLIRNKTQKRRLLQLHGHALPQRSVKHRIARGIGESRPG